MLLLDTGPLAMTILGSDRLKEATREVLLAADRVCVSAISFYEIGQKVRSGKWAEMAPYVRDLGSLTGARGIEVLPLMPETSLSAALLNWEHRDPFDRLIAATALAEGVAVVSPDSAFDSIGVDRVW